MTEPIRFREYTDSEGRTYSTPIDVDPATVPDLPALAEVGMRDARDDVLPWQAQQLERLGYEGPPPRDRFEAQEFIDRLKPSKAAPRAQDADDLTADQLDAMYAEVVEV
jgi:hypothetical protein